MKKIILTLSMFLAALGLVAPDTFASTPASIVSSSQNDEKREKIAATDLPEAISKAWGASPNAKAEIKEIQKVTSGDAVWFEISYAGADGTVQIAKYNGDGAEIQ